MSTVVTDQQTITAVDHALTGFRASLDQLIAAVEDGGLDHLDDSALVGFLQAFETERNRLWLVDHGALRDAEHRHLAERLGQSQLTTVLTSALRISAGEAARRVRPVWRSGTGCRCSASLCRRSGRCWPRRSAAGRCRRSRCRSSSAA